MDEALTPASASVLFFGIDARSVVDKRWATGVGDCGANTTVLGELFFNMNIANKLWHIEGTLAMGIPIFEGDPIFCCLYVTFGVVIEVTGNNHRE